MSADHVEAGISQRLLSDLESIDRRVVLGNEELVTSHNLAQRLLRFNRLNPFFSNSSEIFFTARKFTGEASKKDNNLLIIVYILYINYAAKIMQNFHLISYFYLFFP